MDQVSSFEVKNCVIHDYSKYRLIKVNGFTEFEKKGLYFPVDILVKSFDPKTDMFVYDQYFRVELSAGYNRPDHWVHSFYPERLWKHVYFNERIVGYRPTICNSLIGTCEAKDTESFESMLLEDVGT